MSMRMKTLLIIFLILTLWSTYSISDNTRTQSGASRETYFESFDNGQGGWIKGRMFPMTIFDGVAHCYSPWWVDANHAPPGGGYLNLIMWTYTNEKFMTESLDWFKSKGVRPPYTSAFDSKFIANNHSTDLTNTRLSVRMRGEIDLKGTQLYLLVQGKNDKTTANYIFKGQPFIINREWTEQTVTLTPDPSQWLCIGARHDMTDEYGCFPIDELLSDVNVDIIFVLFPVNVVPVEKVADKNKLRAVEDYHVDQSFLPKGVIMFDWIKIEYPEK